MLVRLLLVLALALGLTRLVQATTLPNSATLRLSSATARLVIESAQPIAHKTFAMRQPERFVVDLHETQLNAALKGLAGQLDSTHPFLRKLRVAQFNPHTVRIVLETHVAFRSKMAQHQVAPNQHQLVLDLSTAASPAASRSTEDSGSRRDFPPAKQRFVVAIDAGHGGQDPGAIGASGSREKEITLAIARRLKQHIDAQPNLHAVLVRDGDYFVPLRERVRRARKARADLFLSIHADAFMEPDARGSSVFALSEKGATSEAARRLARQENQADLVGGISISTKDVHLARTLLDLSQTATIQDSLKLGKIVLAEIGELNSLHKKRVEQAGFAVLKAPDIPSILVETAFISNPEEERRLRDPAFQDNLARALVDGIQKYFDTSPAARRSAQGQR